MSLGSDQIFAISNWSENQIDILYLLQMETSIEMGEKCELGICHFLNAFKLVIVYISANASQTIHSLVSSPSSNAIQQSRERKCKTKPNLFVYRNNNTGIICSFIPLKHKKSKERKRHRWYFCVHIGVVSLAILLLLFKVLMTVSSARYLSFKCEWSEAKWRRERNTENA